MGTIAISSIPSQATDSFSGRIPEILCERLAAHNIFSPTDWQRMTPRQRGNLFGITAAHVAIINRATGVKQQASRRPPVGRC